MPYTPEKFDRTLDTAAVELRRSSHQFVENLGSFDWFGLLRAILFGDENTLAIHSNRLLVILQTYVARVQLLPARVAAFVAAESATFPKKASNRVLRGDQAMRFTLKEVIDTGFELASGRFVPIYDVFKGFERLFLRFRVFAFLDTVALFRLAKGTVLAIVLVVIKILWAIFVTLATTVLVYTLAHKWNLDSQWRSIESNFLSDDSRRVRKWIRGKRQFRVNVQPGPDF